jgi:hypothetical protein
VAKSCQLQIAKDFAAFAENRYWHTPIVSTKSALVRLAFPRGKRFLRAFSSSGGAISRYNQMMIRTLSVLALIGISFVVVGAGCSSSSSGNGSSTDAGGVDGSIATDSSGGIDNDSGGTQNDSGSSSSGDDSSTGGDDGAIGPRPDSGTVDGGDIDAGCKKGGQDCGSSAECCSKKCDPISYLCK